MKRREFLGATIPSIFLPNLFQSQNFSFLGSINESNLDNDRALVIVQLQGGNDGLNTVIPIDKYSLYANARANIAIPENKILPLNSVNYLGLHPSMTGMANLFNTGKLNIINGVSYPNPSFSHFRATDIWNSGSPENVISTGWAGRFLNQLHPNYPTGYPNTNYPDPLAMQIGSTLPMSLQGITNPMGIAITSTDNFYNMVGNVNGAVPNTYAGKELDFLRTVSVQSNAYAKTITAAALKVGSQGAYPSNNTLADKLKIVARLIAGGLKTKIYVVNISGFDTHSNQTNATDTLTGTHANLWQKVSEAISSFQSDIEGLGIAKRVVGFTFSEFGRRIKSNASGGTDHGAAAPMFVFGANILPGVLGTTPEISAKPTDNDNVAMQYDFRSVYSSIFERWFCSSASDIKTTLFNNFASLPIIPGTICNVSEVLANEPNNDINVFTNFPNPFSESTQFKFQSMGGHCMIEVFDNSGKKLMNAIDGDFEKGSHQITFNTENLNSGLYFARFQNNGQSIMRKILKA